MKKIRILCAVLAMVMAVSCLGLLSVSAETQPSDVIYTQPATNDPVTTEPATAPATVPMTEPVTVPTDNTASTVSTEPVTEYTEPATQAPRPTEYDEDDEPSTYSDYVSPAPVYTPAEQDFEANDWEEIELNIDSDAAVSGGVGDFSAIKNNTSKGDEKSPLLLILCIVFWCLAVSCLTFVILYKPKAAKALQAAGKGKTAPQSKGKSQVQIKGAQTKRNSSDRRNPDDYNDGF